MRSTSLLRSAAILACMTMALSANAQIDRQTLADRWMKAYNTFNQTGLANLYTEEARLMIHGAPTIAGRDRIEEYWAADFQDGNPLTLMDVTHHVSGTDLTLVHGNYRVINRDDGARLGFGRFAHIWTRADNGEWHLDRDMWNQPYEPYNPSSAENDIQGLADQWTQAYNQHDRAALAALYTDDAWLMMHGAPTIAGRRAIGEFWTEDFQEDNPLTLLTVTHGVDGLDYILVHGDYEVVNRSDGNKIGFGRFSHIWTLNENDEWRLDRDLWQQRFEPADTR